MTGAWMSGARLAVIAAACSTSVALAACGGGGDEAGASAGDREQRFQEAGLKFAKCMRENGVDVPDPEAGQPGAVFRFREGAPDDPNFQRAEEKCRKHLEAARPEISEEQQAEFRDAALNFARCMRKEGVDFPDPTFDSQGRGRIGLGDAVRPDDPGFREAAERCRENMPGGGPFGGPPPGGGP